MVHSGKVKNLSWMLHTYNLFSFANAGGWSRLLLCHSSNITSPPLRIKSGNISLAGCLMIRPDQVTLLPEAVPNGCIPANRQNLGTSRIVPFKIENRPWLPNTSPYKVLLYLPPFGCNFNVILHNYAPVLTPIWDLGWAQGFENSTNRNIDLHSKLHFDCYMHRQYLPLFIHGLFLSQTIRYRLAILVHSQGHLIMV